MPLTLILQRCKVLLSDINNGIIFQYGTDNISGSYSTRTINFPISFTIYYSIGSMLKCGTARDTGWCNGIIEKRLSSFDMYQRDSGTSGFDYIVIGI